MEFLSRHWKRLLWFAALVGFILWLASGWRLESRQKKLLKAIETGDMGDLKSLVSDNYSDDWGFKREDILQAMDEFTLQFVKLDIYPHEEAWTSNGSEAAYSARLRFGGNPMTPMGGEIQSRAASLKKPVVFHWVKESWWPWAWKLQKVTQSELKLEGEYKPGMFRNAVE